MVTSWLLTMSTSAAVSVRSMLWAVVPSGALPERVYASTWWPREIASAAVRADHAGCADDCDVHEGFFSGGSSVVFLAVFRVMVL